jgi:hypothetical protein
LAVPPKGGATSVSVIQLALDLVLDAGVTLRAVPRVLAALGNWLADTLGLPAWTSARWWLLRLGYYALTCPKEQADDWAYLLDHTVQIGTVKMFVVLGVRLSQLPYPQRCLGHEDVQLLALVPMEHSTGLAVDDQLEQVAARTGVPRLLVSDHGSDVKKGVELYCTRHPQTAATYDLAHKGACCLERRLEADERWQTFVTRLGETKARVRQTPEAALLAPSLRPKARYMNLGPVLRWGQRLLRLLDRGVAGGAVVERAESKYGWLREYRAALTEWGQWQDVTQQAVGYVRSRGHYWGVGAELAAQLAALPLADSSRLLADELSDFVADQAAQARPGERLVASTEVLESCLGKLKTLERQQAKSGFTGLVLSLGALVGTWTAETITEALEATPLKAVKSWCAKQLGPSVQAQRRAAFAGLESETKPG